MINSTRCAILAKQACATFSQVVQKITPPIANNFLKFFFALFAILTLNAATAWGAEVTYVMYPDGGSTFNSEWNKTSRTAKQTYASKVVVQMMGVNGGVYGEITSKTTVANINAISVKCTANNAQKLTLYYSTNNSQWTELSTTSISKNTSSYSDYDIDIAGIPATAYIKFRAEKNSIYLYSITISTSEVATPVDPAVTFSNGSYTVGGSVLDLSTLWTSDSDGAVTYSIVEAGTTGASINGTSFTATAAGTCIVKASQAATSAYNAITKTATITVTAPAPAIITLFEAGATSSVSGKYVGDSYTLPSTSSQACGDKTFVGWSTEIIENSPTKPTAATYFEPGASVTLGATNKFYAVFAEGDGSEILTSITGGDWSTGADGDWSTYGTGIYSGNGVKFDDANDYVTSPDMSSKGYTRLLLKFKSGHNGGQGSVLTFCAYNKNATLLTEDDVTIAPKTVVPTDAYTAQNTIYQVNISANEVIGKIMIIMTSKTKNLGMKYCEIFGVSSSYQNYTTKCVQTYKVTFNANGHGTAPTAQNVEENTKATEPTEPSATGYTFDGWYTDQACSDDKKFDFDTPITEDITLYAKWTINQYTVTLNPNYPDGQTGTFTDKDGNIVSGNLVLTYDYNTASMSLTDLYQSIELEGYQFNGWYSATSGGSKWTSTSTITRDVTVYAQWSKLYTITLSENGTETTLTPQTSNSYTLRTVLTAGSCQDDTKELVGWSTVAIPTPGDMPTSKFYELGETVTLSEDKTTFYAVFATPTTIPGGTEEKEVVTILDFSNQGYENQQEVTSLTIGEVTVTFNKGSNSNTPKYYNTGTAVRVYGSGYFTVTVPNESFISTIALTFGSGDESNTITTNSNTYSNGTWTGSAQSVKFTVGGTTGHRRIKSVKVTYTTTIQADDIVTYSNYSTKCVPTCKITYNFDGGEGECTTAIVEEGSEYTLCATAPAKAGHEFLNWKDQYGTAYEAGDKITSVTEDLTLTAQWQVNSYEVTWMSLGSKLSSSDVNYNTQPTQPTTNPTYLCGTDKEFVGWTTQEIDGVGTPTDLYTTEFPAVTADVTYHAVFAGRSTETSITTNTLTITENLGQYKEGTITDEQGAIWNYYAGGSQDKTINLRNNSGEKSYLASPKFAGTVQSITAHVTNGSASARKVYLCSSAVASPSGGDLGVTSIAGNNNSKVTFVIADGKSFDQFYIQVSGALQFKDIVVTSSLVGENYVDYVTSCEEVGSDMSNSTLVTPSVESGIFSVGGGKYVQFSTGNLQYEVGTNTWSFASEQYEVIGGEAYTGSNNTNKGMNVPGYTGKLDLFAWSSDGKFGVNPSNTDDDYGYAATDFVDWGTLVNETGWYTLTEDEMKHILARTKNGKTLWALATVNGLNGLILLPDNWNTSISLVYGYVPTQFVYTENQLAISQWEALEAAGAVFLPAAGSRTGGYGNTDKAGGKGAMDANNHYFHVDNVGVYGYYWLNTQDTRPAYPHCASFLMLPGWDEGPTVDDEGIDDLSTPPVIWSREKRRGNSVRLVKEVTPNYTRIDQGAGVYGTVCYPENIVWCDGGTLYEVAGKEGNKVIFDEVTTPVAGMPYIFIADQEVLNFFCGTEYEGTAGEYNSLKGTFETIQPAEDNILVGNYMLVNNIIKKCGINCGLYANRAYFVATDLESMGTAPAAAPGRRRISLDVTSENTTTSLDNITNGDNTTIKVIENSQLIIIRNGEKFNAQGQKL